MTAGKAGSIARTAPSGTAGALPERQQHLAEATALWLAGYSKRGACRQTGIPRTTLSVALERAGLTESDRAKYLDIVEDLAVRAAEEAGRQLLERLAGGARLTAMQVATLFGVCSDKLTAIRRLKAPSESSEGGLAALLERLHAGGTATLTVEPARVIEAEAEPQR